MNDDDQPLIEMPDHLLENPPEPRRKDIADLFSKLIEDEKNSKIFEKASRKRTKESSTYYFEIENDNSIKIFRNTKLAGIINSTKYKIYVSIKKIMWYFLDKRQNSYLVVKNPLNSELLSSIFYFINKKNTFNKVKMCIEERNNKKLLKIECF